MKRMMILLTGLPMVIARSAAQNTGRGNGVLGLIRWPWVQRKRAPVSAAVAPLAVQNPVHGAKILFFGLRASSGYAGGRSGLRQRNKHRPAE